MKCHFNGTLLSSVLPPLLVIEIVLGILGNGVALWVFSFHLKPWKSSTVLLFNLALADFFLIMALPFRVSYYMNKLTWMFGERICNLCLFMLAMNRSGSTFFLTAIAVDRYIRVVHPHHSLNFIRISTAVFGALAIWLVTISMTAHIFTLKHVNTTYCESFMIDTTPDLSLNWHKFEFLLSFYLPLLVILYCTIHIIIHLKGRQLAQNAKMKKALCFLTLVVVVFIICFLPSNITQLVIWVKTNHAVRTLPETEVCPALEEVTSTFYISISLTYLNSMLDPLVYYLSIPAFKNFCRNALRLPPAEPTESTKTRESGSQSLSQL